MTLRSFNSMPSEGKNMLSDHVSGLILGLRPANEGRRYERVDFQT